MKISSTGTDPFFGVVNGLFTFQVDCNRASLVRSDLSVEGVSITERYDPPIPASPAQLAPPGHVETGTSIVTSLFGCQYAQTNTLEILGPETVTTPAGTFDAVKIRNTMTTQPFVCRGEYVPDLTETSLIWLAPGIGLVKESYEDGEWELVSYTLQ